MSKSSLYQPYGVWQFFNPKRDKRLKFCRYGSALEVVLELGVKEAREFKAWLNSLPLDDAS